MHRFLTANAAIAFLLLIDTRAARAQAWNDIRTRALVQRATERRARQLADTGLADYSATAHGYLTFLAQLGEGFPDPPKVVKADQIALEVYWRAPNYSKQVIVGRRDTIVLPTDIQYHRDHLGIVQNNFPNIIRVGEGDEVRDVPHPLSTSGLATYDFAISDSMRIGIPGRTIDVYEVKLRPRNDGAAAAVGALFLARDDAQVVRMAFSFTRAALIDKELEDVSIVLDNALIEGRFWLPRRQEVEIRRTGTWLDFPARGIIRGWWEICCYQVNHDPRPLPFFAGPEIVNAPEAVRAAHKWEGRILDSLPPDVRAVTDQDVSRVQSEARALVRDAALARGRQTSLAAPSLSDVLRVNRAEGLSLGTGVRHRLGHGFDWSASGRFGFADHAPKGIAGLSWQGGGNSVQMRIFREYRDAGDEPETSGLRNSIAAQEFGSDYTEPVDWRGAELNLERRDRSNGRWRLSLGHESSDSVRVMARPALGSYEPTLPARPGHGPRLALGYERGSPALLAGFQLRGRIEGRIGRLTPADTGTTTSFLRIFGSLQLDRPWGQQRFVLRGSGGAAWTEGSRPAQENLFAGGPTTGPGYAFHQFIGARLLSLRAEWQTPIPFPSIPLGRWGRIPGRALIVPVGNTVYLGEGAPFRPEKSGWYPSFGLGLVAFFDLLRLDVARGTRRGQWAFNVDLVHDFWRIL